MKQTRFNSEENAPAFQRKLRTMTCMRSFKKGIILPNNSIWSRLKTQQGVNLIIIDEPALPVGKRRRRRRSDSRSRRVLGLLFFINQPETWMHSADCYCFQNDVWHIVATSCPEFSCDELKRFPNVTQGRRRCWETFVEYTTMEKSLDIFRVIIRDRSKIRRLTEWLDKTPPNHIIVCHGHKGACQYNLYLDHSDVMQLFWANIFKDWD